MRDDGLGVGDIGEVQGDIRIAGNAAAGDDGGAAHPGLVIGLAVICDFVVVFSVSS